MRGGLRRAGAARVTRAELAAELRGLGLGDLVMVHTRMSAIGHVDGAQDTVVAALLDALGPSGTLVAYLSWDEHVYDEPIATPWDPETARSSRDHGRIPERIRTWPGTLVSDHPEARVAAVGPRAAWLVDPHPAGDGYGARSPFARFVEAGGQVLMLGAPLDTVTLLHHAEAIARVPEKRTRTTIANGVAVVDIDTEHGPFAYDTLGLEEDEFIVIARDALASGVGTRGRVGAAECHVFPAPELVSFAVSWLEERFA